MYFVYIWEHLEWKIITPYLVFLLLWYQNTKYDWSLNDPSHHLEPSPPLPLANLLALSSCTSTRPLWLGLSRGIYLEGRCWQSSLVSEKLDSCLNFKIYVYLGIKQKWFILWVSSGPVKSWILSGEFINSEL